MGRGDPLTDLFPETELWPGWRLRPWTLAEAAGVLHGDVQTLRRAASNAGLDLVAEALAERPSPALRDLLIAERAVCGRLLSAAGGQPLSAVEALPAGAWALAVVVMIRLNDFVLGNIPAPEAPAETASGAGRGRKTGTAREGATG